MTLKEKLAELERQLTQLRKERDDYRVRQTVEKEQLEKRIAEVTEEGRGLYQTANVQRERACRAEGAADALVLVLRKAGLVEAETDLRHGAARVQSRVSYGDMAEAPRWKPQ